MAESNAPEDKKRIVPEMAPTAVSGAALDSNDPALREALQLSSGKTIKELEEDGRRREHTRDQNFREHFECLAIASMYVLFAAMCIVGFVWLWHVILPEKC